MVKLDEFRISLRIPEFLQEIIKVQDDKTHYIINAITFYEQYKNLFKDTKEDANRQVVAMRGWHSYLVKCPKCGYKQKFSTKSKYLVEVDLQGKKYHRKSCEKCGQNFIIHKNPRDSAILKKLF